VCEVGPTLHTLVPKVPNLSPLIIGGSAARTALTEHPQLCRSFGAMLAVDIAGVITHIVLGVVQESTPTLRGHGRFTLALIEPVAV
jgi:hypothetical protein